MVSIEQHTPLSFFLFVKGLCEKVEVELFNPLPYLVKDDFFLLYIYFFRQFKSFVLFFPSLFHLKFKKIYEWYVDCLLGQ